MRERIGCCSFVAAVCAVVLTFSPDSLPRAPLLPVRRVHESDMTLERFIEEHVVKGIPLVIEGGEPRGAPTPEEIVAKCGQRVISPLSQTTASFVKNAAPTLRTILGVLLRVCGEAGGLQGWMTRREPRSVSGFAQELASRASAHRRLSSRWLAWLRYISQLGVPAIARGYLDLLDIALSPTYLADIAPEGICKEAFPLNTSTCELERGVHNVALTVMCGETPPPHRAPLLVDLEVGHLDAERWGRRRSTLDESESC